MDTQKLFPLRLCEVLEQEVMIIHGLRPPSDGWLLGAGDLDIARWREEMVALSNGPFAAAVQAVCEKLKGVKDSDLVAELNKIIRGDADPYDPRLLASDAEPRRMWELRLSPPEGAALQPDERMLLNRLLVEELFSPAAIARVDTVRLAALFEQIHAHVGGFGGKVTRSALCLSGGGIRSASFALGVMQALARFGVLERFDYLSTVSGGGYVGSWLSTWIHRHPRGLAGVIKALQSAAEPEAGGVSAVVEPEPAPLRFLRSYSLFLNPKGGLLSADTWTWIAIYVRNLSVNWLAVVPLLVLLVLVPRMYSAMMFDWARAHGDYFPHFFWIASIAAVAALVCVTVNRPSISDRALPGQPADEARGGHRLRNLRKRYKTQSWIVALGVFPMVTFALLLTLLVWGLPATTIPMTWGKAIELLHLTPWLEIPRVFSIIAYGHLWAWGETLVVASFVVAIAMLSKRGWVKRFKEFLALVAAGAVTWFAVAQLAEYAAAAGDDPRDAFTVWSIAIHPAHLYAILAIPAAIVTALGGMTIFIAAVSKFAWIEDEDREWWARFGAWTLIFAVGWAVLSAIVILGPVLLVESPRIVGAIGGASGLIAVLLGNSRLSSATQKEADARTQSKGIPALLGRKLLPLASLVFLAALIASVSLLVSAAFLEVMRWATQYPPPTGAITDILRASGVGAAGIDHACVHGTPWVGWTAESLFEDSRMHLAVACQTGFALTLAFAVVAALALGLAGLMVNLNKFSLHAAYRMRIVRTFLGASRGEERKPNPFTDFDPMDNVQMHELQPGLLRDGDIVDIAAVMSGLKAALEDETHPLNSLAAQLCSKENDRFGLLRERIENQEPGTPVLQSVQRMLIETANRLLETASPAQATPSGNRIFANRLRLEALLPKAIRAYEFPPPPPHRLVHVLNLTLNIVRGGRLAWQERMAAPFSVTPLHTGSYYLGFRHSRDYGGKDGISIGTAAAISGAAVSPNMGYSSSPVIAILLTIFNVRLGWWLGNPGLAGARTYRFSEPRFSLRPLVSEALGLTNDHSPYAYLSDGGHFENLGLFEMVLRRCKLIVVSDAGADPQYQFGDLGNAVRKIRIDLGIPIEFPDIPIHKGEVCSPGRYCAIGRIEYSAVDGATAPDGVIVVFKPTLLGKEPRDVANYAAENKDFPQQPTSDQFFAESQFESYRQLGYFAVRTACSSRPQDATDTSWADSFEKAVRAHCAP
jgi:hypothetical protein